VEQLDRRLGRTEHRQPGPGEQRARLGDLAAAHPAAAQLEPHLGGEVDDVLRHLDRIDERVRREDHQHVGNRGVLGEGEDGVAVQLRAGVTAEVERVVGVPLASAEALERGDRRRAQPDESGAEVLGAVGGEIGRAAAVGDDGEAVLARSKAAGQGLGGEEELVDVLHPHHAGAAHRRVEDHVGEAGVVRVGGVVVAATVAAGLEQDDRLDARGRAQCAHELAGVADVIDVQQDVARLRVVDQVLQRFPVVDVHRAAERDDRREADVVGQRPVEHDRAHRARLRDQGDLAGLDGDAGERGIDPAAGACDAQAAGPDQAQPGLARGLDDAALECVPAGADDDRVAYAAAPALRGDAVQHARGGGDDGEIDRSADVLDRAVAGMVLDAAVLRVDRVQGAAIAAFDQVAEDDAADGPGCVGRADDGDRGRFEGGAESVGAGHDLRAGKWMRSKGIAGRRPFGVDLRQGRAAASPSAKENGRRDGRRKLLRARTPSARRSCQRSSKLILRRLVVARAWQLST
jgi:hypothetical protein